MKLIPPLLALIGGILVGWFWFSSTSPPSRQSSSTAMGPNKGLPVEAGQSQKSKRQLVDASFSGSWSFTQKQAHLQNFDDQSSISEIRHTLEIIDQMATDELLAALRASEKKERASRNPNLLPNFLFRALWERDSAEAENYYSSLSDEDMRRVFRRTLYKVKTDQDLAQSIRDLALIGDYDERDQALGLIIRNLAKTKPLVTLKLIESKENATASAYKHLFSEWASSDPSAAITQLELLPIGPKRRQALNGLVETLTVENPQLAFEFAQVHLTGTLKDNVINHLVASLAKENVNEAITILNQLNYGRAYNSAVYHIAKEWGKKDTDAALRWARGLEEGSEKRKAILNVLTGLAGHNPEQAKSYYWTLSDRHRKKMMARAISQKIAENKPAEAFQWLESLPDKEVAKFARGELMAKQIHRDVNWVVENQASDWNEEQLTGLAAVVVRKLSEHDLAAAEKWVRSLNDGKARDRAVRSLAYEWTKHNAYEASEWISSLEAGDARDGAIDVLLYNIRENDPVSAFAWATTVSDAKKRRNLARHAIDVMKRAGQSERAILEINSSDLSDEEKEFLSGRLE